ncbi:hypothetical protein GCWU000342_00880 [Shuttleworthella satelles DSM 14600]|uniref:Uncharacterized protein n=1 Tax=Shuttleworthella satelles DSM 14600 TaxID=626523 RepID=C4GAD2_9FIRM|nr:hypothetical protein GCWU000342_00880 [Shuttleworthia satelles DSM 14600]
MDKQPPKTASSSEYISIWIRKTHQLPLYIESFHFQSPEKKSDERAVNIYG